jgi:2-keto-3-deoxy-L-rhamnonate aldolase RhmA
MRDNPLLKRLSDDKAAVASFVTIPDSFVAEVMGKSGVDAVIIDTEHSAMSASQLQTVLTALYPSDAAVIVRVPENDDVWIKQALDLGAEGVLVPGISSARDCARAVASAFYPPKGRRGFGPRRASRLHGERADYLRRANDQIAVIAMIESVCAQSDLEAIVTVAGLSAIFVGAADLAVSMGYLHDLGNDAVQQEISRITEVCTRHRVPFGVFTATEKTAAEWIDRGAQIVTLGSDLQYLDAGIARTAAARTALVDRDDRLVPN